LSSLKQKSIDGVFWSLLEKFGIQFIKLFLGIILARLLTPADYGMIGMITIFISLSLTFIDSGFGLAYIQKQDANEKDASTIFYFNLIVSTLLYIVLWFSAPLISNFYGENQLIEIIRILSLVLIVNSFGMIQLTKLKKDVKFKKKTILIIFSTLISGSAGIIFALNGYGVWSLVIQTLTKASIESIGLWIFYKWRPQFYFSVKSLKSMFSFSAWSLITNLTSTFFENLYYIVIGKFFPAAQLGFYTKAKQFQQTLSKTTSNAVGTVAFPVFSKMQNDKVALKNAVKKFIQHTMFFVVPLSLMFVVIAEPFFIILLTEKWAQMIPFFQLLLIAGIFYPMQMVNVQVITAMGFMKLNFKLSLLKNALRVINIIFTYKYGVIFIIIGEIAFSFLALAINTFFTKRFLRYGFFEQIKDVAIIFVASIIIAVLAYRLTYLFDNYYIKISISILFIISTYLFSMKLFNKKLFNANVSIITNKLRQK
jgi:O-antigen/teichoic acid export membrane protein